MFRLGDTQLPTNSESLSSAITRGLAEVLTLPTGRAVINSAGDYPNFARVAIDLTGAKLTGEPPIPPKGIGQTQPGPSAAQFEFAANPMYLRDSPVELSLSAQNARFDYDRDAGGRPMLVLAGAGAGTLRLAVANKDLDALALAAAREGAGKYGVQILETQLLLTPVDARTVAVAIRIKGKKMFGTATLNLRGSLSVDDALNAKVSGLSINGEGMLGDMVCAAIRPKLMEVDGKVFPFTVLSLGDVRLRDLRVEVGDKLRVTAAFGS